MKSRLAQLLQIAKILNLQAINAHLKSNLFRLLQAIEVTVDQKVWKEVKIRQKHLFRKV